MKTKEKITAKTKKSHRIKRSIFLFILGAITLLVCESSAFFLHDIYANKSIQIYEQFKSKVIKLNNKIFEKKPELDSNQWQEMLNEIHTLANKQENLDTQMLAEINSEVYSAEDPLIIVNPYGTSPFTALILFTSEEELQSSIFINGDTKLAEVKYSFQEFRKKHIIPVYGLYADRVNEVILTLTNHNGEKDSYSFEIETDSLPSILAADKIYAHLMDDESYQPGFTFTQVGSYNRVCKTAIDVNGKFRWYLDLSESPLIYTKLSQVGLYTDNGTIIVPSGSNGFGNALLLEFNFLGKLLRVYTVPYGVHHELQVYENRLYAAGSADLTGELSIAYEIDTDTGKIVSKIDLCNYLQPYRDPFKYISDRSAYILEPDDWCHLNSIFEYGDDLIISCRNQSTVVCMNMNGDIKWMLGDPSEYFAYFRNKFLTPVGENFDYFYMQHCANVMPDQDGDPDTLDIILFDNGNPFLEEAQQYSRMVQYRINEKKMTVEQVWDYGKGHTELYSVMHGSAFLLENGNRLGSFEPVDRVNNTACAYGIEVKADGTEVWDCWRLNTESNNYREYRLVRKEIYTEGVNDLKIGQPAVFYLED